MMGIGYYFVASYRRKVIDKFQAVNIYRYHGTVLDIGGRDKGIFKSPKNKVQKWIIADIESSRKPDLILDVADMKNVASQSVDVINAIELFEHVKHIDRGLSECARVLKNGGTFIVTCPFVYPVHGDPDDYQRWTESKWRLSLESLSFKVDSIRVTGRFFTVMGDMLKAFIGSLPMGIRHLLYIFSPIIDCIVLLDRLPCVIGHRRLGKYHGGYFIIAHKK